MEISPLSLVVLLVYGLVLAAALTVWAALTVGHGREEGGPERRPERRQRSREQRLSNDDLRGARSRGQSAAGRGDDPFERFLRAGNDDVDFG